LPGWLPLKQGRYCGSASASGLLLVREAGGEVTDFSGRRAGIDDREIIAANPRIGQAFRGWLEQK